MESTYRVALLLAVAGDRRPLLEGRRIGLRHLGVHDVAAIDREVRDKVSAVEMSKKQYRESMWLPRLEVIRGENLGRQTSMRVEYCLVSRDGVPGRAELLSGRICRIFGGR
jgi:hypothetical protein